MKTEIKNLERRLTIHEEMASNFITLDHFDAVTKSVHNELSEIKSDIKDLRNDLKDVLKAIRNAN